jgi:hypothetical protein
MLGLAFKVAFLVAAPFLKGREPTGEIRSLGVVDVKESS